MAENNPDRKIGIVTFTDNVQIVGDGSKPITRIESSQLNDYNYLLKNAVASASSHLNLPLK